MLQTVYAQEPTSRADIARLTGLTRPTVSELVTILMAESLVEELGPGPAIRGGKPPTLLALRNTSHHIVAVDLSRRPFAGAITDLRGNIVLRLDSQELFEVDNPALSSVERLVGDLVAATDGPVLGIGIGTPGVVSPSGEIITASNLGLENVNMAELLADIHGLPVQVSNDADAAALAEFSRGAGSSTTNLVVVTVGEGIGAGIILNGRLYAGDGFAAGELGHISAVDRGGAQCRCGKRGCLETVTAIRGILRNANIPTEALNTNLSSVRAAELLAAAAGSSAVRTAGRSLGAVLATLVSILDVHRIVIAGSVVAVGEGLLEAVKREVGRRVLSPIAPTIEVTYSTLGSDTVLIGSAARVLSAQLGVVWQ